MLESLSEQKLANVSPELADKVRKMAAILEGEGIPIRVTQGFRSFADQAAIYAQGRTAPGLRVTKAKPGHSWHEFGLAVDVVPLTLPHGQPDWNPSHAAWKRIIAVGESLGLFSGDQFIHCPKDEPHFQLTGEFPLSPDDHVRWIYATAGTSPLWASVASGLKDDAQPIQGEENEA